MEVTEETGEELVSSENVIEKTSKVANEFSNTIENMIDSIGKLFTGGSLSEMANMSNNFPDGMKSLLSMYSNITKINDNISQEEKEKLANEIMPIAVELLSKIDDGEKRLETFNVNFTDGKGTMVIEFNETNLVK